MKSAIRIAKEFIRTIEALQTVPGMHASYDREREVVCRYMLLLAGEHLEVLRRIRDGQALTATEASTRYEEMAIDLLGDRK